MYRVHSIKYEICKIPRAYTEHTIGYETEYYQTLKYFFFRKGIEKSLAVFAQYQFDMQIPHGKKRNH